MIGNANNGQERQRKLSALLALSANFGKPFEKHLLSIWMELLRPEAPEAVEFAVGRVIESYEYKTIPPFAVLKRFLPQRPGASLADSATASRAKAEAEWTALTEAVRRFGSWNEPVLNPVTAFVVRGMGGWGAVCRWETGELHWRRKEFLEAWENADRAGLPAMEGGAKAVEERRVRMGLGIPTASETPRRIGAKSAVQRLRDMEGEGRA